MPEPIIIPTIYEVIPTKPNLGFKSNKKIFCVKFKLLWHISYSNDRFVDRFFNSWPLKNKYHQQLGLLNHPQKSVIQKNQMGRQKDSWKDAHLKNIWSEVHENGSFGVQSFGVCTISIHQIFFLVKGQKWLRYRCFVRKMSHFVIFTKSTVIYTKWTVIYTKWP